MVIAIESIRIVIGWVRPTSASNSFTKLTPEWSSPGIDDLAVGVDEPRWDVGQVVFECVRELSVEGNG
jgi:hypothetical protein